MTLSDQVTAPPQRSSSLDPVSIDIHIPALSHAEQPATTDFLDFDESHIIRGYD